MSDAAGRFEAVYLANREDIYSFLMSMVRNRSLALDLSQDAFINFFQSYKDRLPDDLSCRKLLFRIARNLAINEGSKHYNRKITLVPSFDSEAGATSPSAERAAMGSMEAQNLREHLDRLISALGEPDRTIILLRYESGFKIEAIAEIVDLSISAVSRRIDAAKRRIVDLGKKSGFNPGEYKQGD